MSILYIISISLIILGYILLMIGASVNMLEYKTKDDRIFISKMYRLSLISSSIGIFLLFIGLIVQWTLTK